MKLLKQIIRQLLGEKAYLRLMARVFHVAFKQGWLERNPMYAAHYFVHHLIGKNDTVIDLGANLGYYTKLFAELVGKNGCVIAVEPIPMYREILTRQIAGYDWVQVLPYALGEKEDTIIMGNPEDAGQRHGLMHVLNDDEINAGGTTYSVTMRNPVALFSGLKQLDYIKCDIEGYEIPVIPLMLPIIKKHLPIVQVETTSENLPAIFSLFNNMGYTTYNVIGEKLVPFVSPTQHLYYDLFAVPPQRLAAVQGLIEHHG